MSTRIGVFVPEALETKLPLAPVGYLKGGGVGTALSACTGRGGRMTLSIYLKFFKDLLFI